MHSIPKFKIYQDEETPDGVFDWGSSRDKLFEAYHEASDLYFMGEIEEAKEILQDTVKQDSHFIDAFNLLGNIELDFGSYEKGRQHHQKALQIGEQILPDSFDGRIRWGFIENRPFLRALHSVAMDYMYENNYAQSIRLLEKILDYNPDDNQGVRYLTGDLYFLENAFKKAEATYKKNLDYPPYLYSYGLLHYVLGNYVKAITLFRKGILSNIYISDFLRMKVPLIPYEIWHSTNFEMPETAYSYVDMMTRKWMEYPGAVDLLQFLHLIEPSHSEIQEVYTLKNELYFLDSGIASEEDELLDLRGEIADEVEKIKNSISDDSSTQILKYWKENPAGSGFWDMKN